MMTLKSTFIIQDFLISTNYSDHYPHFTQEYGISEEVISVLKPRAGAGVTGGSIWKNNAYFSFYYIILILLEGKVGKY